MAATAVVTAAAGLTAVVSQAPFWFWWLVPVVVTGTVTAGLALVRRARRDRRPRNGADTVEDYARFRAAMTAVRAHHAVRPQQGSR